MVKLQCFKEETLQENEVKGSKRTRQLIMCTFMIHNEENVSVVLE
jgi:hypothetical protein